MKKIALYASLVILAAGCKKEELPPKVDSPPVFSFEGDFDGTPIARQAGNNDYYMFSSHFQDPTGLYVYQGELKSTCPGNCDYGLTVKINDSMISELLAPMKPDNALQTGPYLFNDITKAPTEQKVEMIPLRSYSIQETYNWSFQSASGSMSPLSGYSVAPMLKLGTTYTVSLSFDDNVGSCQTTLTTVYKAGASFHAGIKTLPGANSLSYVFSPEVTGSGPFTYSWEFGDGSTSTDKDPSHVFSTYSTFRVKLTVTKGQESVTTYYQVNTFGDGSCNANFRFNPLPLDYKSVFKTITIELKDKSGNVYSSLDVVQPATSYAEITEVSEYGDVNKNGERTKKIALKFACLLKGPDKTMTVTNAKAVIAVSYK